jgi:GNAT superfamily N-acetyltransferase
MGTELVQLRSFYADPGFVLLATSGGAATGCIALRSLEPGVGEVRRLFVAPTGRSEGLGRRLMLGVIDEARARGFDRLVLNTLPTMTHAGRLYDALGFVPVDPYVQDPTDGVMYFGREL